jgi:hypothetical protein
MTPGKRAGDAAAALDIANAYGLLSNGRAPVFLSMPVEALIAERIGPAWVDRIRALNSGYVDGMVGVELGCSWWISKKQALLSLSSYVENDSEDWDEGWDTVEGSSYPYRIRLFGLRRSEYEPTRG